MGEVDVEWPEPEPWEKPEAAILERILTQHWDMAACRCWVCKEARALGYRPREMYLSWRSNPYPSVRVDQ